VEVRAETPDDVESIARVVRVAFGESGTEVADLLPELRGLITPESGLSLVAEDEGELVGHVLFTPSLLDAPRSLVDVQVLSPLSVLPAWQRRGVGSTLVREGLATMDRRGVPVVFLEGSPDYYPRLGFRPGHEFGFRKPSLRIPDAAFMAVRLAAYEPWMTGTLVYSEIFWRHDAVGFRGGLTDAGEPLDP
jgi:putative acetyltransferase